MFKSRGALSPQIIYLELQVANYFPAPFGAFHCKGRSLKTLVLTKAPHGSQLFLIRTNNCNAETSQDRWVKKGISSECYTTELELMGRVAPADTISDRSHVPPHGKHLKVWEENVPAAAQVYNLWRKCASSVVNWSPRLWAATTLKSWQLLYVFLHGRTPKTKIVWVVMTKEKWPSHKKVCFLKPQRFLGFIHLLYIQ